MPLLVFSELTPWSDPALSALQRRVHRLLAPRVDGFIVAGSQGVERLRGLGVSPSAVEVALQSADLDGLGDPAAARRARPSGGPVRVLAVCRLVADKNLDVLIDAFAEARFADGEAELAIRGTGPLEPELRSLAGRLGVPAELSGPVAPGQLGEVYASADVLALVSSYEPFGVTLREGAAAGLPLIASRRAGAAGDVAVDGENAIVVDPDHRSEIADALRRLVGEPELRERLAAGSRAVTAAPPAGGRRGGLGASHPASGGVRPLTTRDSRGLTPNSAGSRSSVTVSCTASERYGRSSSAALSRYALARSSGISNAARIAGASAAGSIASATSEGSSLRARREALVRAAGGHGCKQRAVRERLERRLAPVLPARAAR